MKNLYKVSAFTFEGKGGNKAGVYVHADQLTDHEMQKIAFDLGFSETAFVLESEVADFKVRFFTPTIEVDLCGHATIATFHTLKYLNIINDGLYTQETKAGILKIKVIHDEIYMQQNKPTFFGEVSKEELKPCFNHIDYIDHLNPLIVSTGLREIFICVKNRDTLNRMKPNIKEILKISDIYHVIGIHVFTLDDEIDAYGRNFAPMVGIIEESATGTSNGALACLISQYIKPKDQYILRQGFSMNLPSEIIVNLSYSNHLISDVYAGGKAIIIE